jgi:colanic acid biosynthesis glycosyl transferase WcaI
MRVFFVNRFFCPDESATSRILSMLTESLAGEGREVHVLTSRHLHDQPHIELPTDSAERGAVVRRLWSTRFGRGTQAGRILDYLTFHLGVFFELLRLGRRGDVCVVCTDPPLVSATAAIAASLKGIKTIEWSFDLFPEVAIDLGVIPQGPIARLLLALRDAAYRRASCIVVPIRRMGEALTRRGIDPDRIAVVPNWSDGDAIRPLDREESPLRREWGLEGRFVVAYSGNLGRAHEFDTLLGVAERLRSRKDVAFLLIGGGHKRERVAAAVRRRGLENVSLKPLQTAERLSDTLGAADLHVVSLLPEMEPYVIPSKFYGIAAAGRPTLFIGDPAGEIAELLERGDCGRAVRVGDVDGATRFVEELAADRSAAADMGRRARSLFESRFTRRIATAEWSRILRRLAPAETDLVAARARKARR